MIKVRIFDAPAYFMTHYADADGAVYLDLSTDFTLDITKEIEQQTSLNKINVEALLGTSLPATPKNERLIGKTAEPGIKGNTYSVFNIQIMAGPRILNHATLRVQAKKEGDKSNSYEVELLDTTNHWAVKLNQIYLDELPFGSMDYTPANIWEVMNLNAQYDDGDPGYYFPLVNYGFWSTNDKFTVSDFRPWIHAKKAFDLAFCMAGWQYSCPILETDTGRKLITYILKEGYTEDETLLSKRKFSATLTADQAMPKSNGNPVYERIEFDEEIEDPGNNYDPLTGFYTGGVYAEFSAEIYVDAYWHDTRWGNARGSCWFSLIHQYADGREFEIDKAEVNFEKFDEKNYQFTSVGEILVKPGDKVFVRHRMDVHGPNTVTVLKKSKFSCKPIYYIPTEGEKFNIQESIRHDKFLDYLKGIDSLFNFKYYTNFPEKKVYILTPYDMTFFGDTVSGFFQSTLEDWTDYIDLTETDTKVPQEEKKNLYYKFKDSTDPVIEKLKLDEKKALFSKYIDKGYDFQDETEKIENPYFEPTLNADLKEHSALRFIHDLPQCTDNDNHTPSFRIAPRILIAYGMVEQYAVNPSGGGSSINYFDQYNSLLMPYAYQFGNAAIGATGTWPNTTLDYPDKYLVYGDKEFDLYNLFYAKYNNEFKNCLKLTLSTFANDDKIHSLNFRKRALINHNGNGLYGRIISVESYNIGEEKGKLIFKADNTSDPTCDVYTPLNPCNNFPTIIITPTGGGNYTISAGGSNASPVNTTVYEWRYEDQTSWTTGTTFNTLDKRVIARITWTYTDGCKSEQRVETIEPCANYPKLCYTRELPDNTLTLYECGVNKDTIAGYLYEFSTNNKDFEQVPEPFYLDDVLPGNIYLRLTVYYVNCPEKVVNEIFDNSESGLDCTYDGGFIPGLIFVHTQGGLYIERTGSILGKVATDCIWFRVAGSDDEWDLYDEKNPELLDTGSGTNWEAKRVITFCNSSCPIYCSDIYTAKTDCPGYVTLAESLTACDYELKWEHPDTPGSNNWKATLINDTDYVIGSLRGWLEQDCGGTVTELNERTIKWNQYNFKTEFSFSWQEGHTIQYLRISKNVAGVQTLNQNVPINVTFTTGISNADLTSAVENTIRLQMSNLYNAVDNIDYDLIVTITGSGSTRTTKISFVSKKVVASTWWGPNKGVDYLRTISPGLVTTDTTSTGAEFQKVATNAPIFQTKTPDGVLLKVKLKVNVGTQFINDSSSNFDNIVLNGTIAVVSEVITTLTHTCTRHDLVPTVSGCSSPTYIWKRGNKLLGTNNTISVYGDKRIDVFVSCNDGCTYTERILG